MAEKLKNNPSDSRSQSKQTIRPVEDKETSSSPEEGTQGQLSRFRGPIFLALFLTFLYLIHPFLSPTLLGGVFAVTLYPAYKKLTLMNLPRQLSALFVTLAFCLIFLFPLGAIVFLGAKAGLDLLQQELTLQSLTNGAAQSELLSWLNIEKLSSGLSRVLPFSLEQINNFFHTMLTRLGHISAELFQKLVSQLPSIMISTVVLLITLYFCLVDGSKIIQFFRRYSFLGPQKTSLLFDILKSTCYSVILASVFAGLIQGLLMLAVCLMTETPAPILIALLTFLASFFPLIGTAPVLIGVFVYHLSTGQLSYAWLILISSIVIGLSDNIVRPYVINRSSAGIHPVIAFISVFGGLSVLGAYGLFLGPILAGIVIKTFPLISLPNKGSETN